MLQSAVLLLLLAQSQTTRSLWESGHRAEAIAALSAEVAHSAASPAARRTLVEWELGVHRYQAAIEHLARLPRDADPLRGVAYYHVGDYEQALRYLDEQVPDHLVMKVDALETLQRFDASDAALTRAVESVGKDDPRILAAQGRRCARERKFTQAVAAFRAALDRDPLEGEALFGLGRALVQAGERDEGLKVLERHRTLTPLLDQWDFARRGVDLAPLHAPNSTALGDAERALGRLDRAERAYRDAAALATPEQLVPNALRHARLLTEDRRQNVQAIELLSAAAERAPDARLFVRAGDLLRLEQRTPEAITLYEKALALRPADVDVLKRLGETRAEMSKAAR